MGKNKFHSPTLGHAIVFLHMQTKLSSKKGTEQLLKWSLIHMVLK